MAALTFTTNRENTVRRLLLATGVTAALAAPAKAHAFSDALCRTPEMARILIEAFNQMNWRDGRKVVDIEQLMTVDDAEQHPSCHGIWDLEDGRQIEGTMTFKPNAAGDPIVHWQAETWPTASAKPSAPPTVIVVPTSTPTPSSFSDGAHDRIAWETWFNGLAGEEHDGAYFWAAQRSLPVPANCTRLGGDGTLGCLEAKKRLDPSDARRKSDPKYRAGWNSIN